MRSDDEEDYDEDDEDVQEDAQEEEMDGTQDMDGPGDEGSEEGDEGDAQEDDEDEDDEDGDGDGDEDEEENDDDEDDDDDDGDEEEDGASDDDDGDDDMDVDGDEARSTQISPARSKASVASALPAHLQRRSLFVPGYSSPPASLTIEAVVGIPLPAPTHALAASACLSYLLTGSGDGTVRAYDFWASVNGAQVMTSQQRAVVGLGEGVSKAGVGRGWWANDVDVVDGGAVVGNRAEPVYSLACEGDALWALTGTQSGPINMYTLRHAPGHRVHSLKGHTNVVSCLALLPGEISLLSGSWDGTVREWDLNTGQTVRTYPSHGAQISSLSLRPLNTPASPAPTISVSAGPDFFDQAEAPAATADAAAEAAASTAEPVDGVVTPPTATPAADAVQPSPPPGDVDMASAKSPDSLFDDDDGEGDAQGESVPITAAATPNGAATPAPNGAVAANGTSAALADPSLGKAKPGLSLALPGMPKAAAAALPQPPSSAASSSSRLFNPAAPTAGRAAAAATIPLLSPTSYRAFSDDVLLVSSMDGQVTLVDRRIPTRTGGGALDGVGRLIPGEKTPPWCMSAVWSGDGTQVLAGRRNGTVDVWDVRKSSAAGVPNVLRTLRTPAESGPVSCIVAFPDGRHIATASTDNVRLWNLAELGDAADDAAAGRRSRSRPPFKIIAGHHGGTVSSMLVDPTSRFLVTASGDRGWQGESTKVVLVHEVKW